MQQKFQVGQVWTTTEPGTLARIVHICRGGLYPIMCNVEPKTGFDYSETLTEDGLQMAGHTLIKPFLVALHNSKHKELVAEIVKTFGGKPQFAVRGSTTVCAVRVGGCMRVSTAICGESDTFKYKRGEKLAMQRLLSGQFALVSSFANGLELAECIQRLQW